MTAATPIALVGCGAWGRFILRDLVALGADVTVVARSDASRGRAVEGGAREVVDDLHRVTGVAGVVVAVPTSQHAQVVDQSLELHVPVFVEKPLTDNLRDAVRFAGRTDVFVMDKWRYHPGVEELRRIRSGGIYGDLRMLRTTRHSTYNPHQDVDAIWILAPHDLAIVLEVTGEMPDPLAAVGSSDGTEASLVGLLVGNVVIDVSSRSPEHRRQIVAEFDDAVVALNDGYAATLDVTVPRRGTTPTNEQLIIPESMPLRLELEAFLAHTTGGPPPRSSADHGILGVERITQLRDLAGL